MPRKALPPPPDPEPDPTPEPETIGPVVGGVSDPLPDLCPAWFDPHATLEWANKGAFIEWAAWCAGFPAGRVTALFNQALQLLEAEPDSLHWAARWVREYQRRKYRYFYRLWELQGAEKVAHTASGRFALQQGTNECIRIPAAVAAERLRAGADPDALGTESVIIGWSTMTHDRESPESG